MSEPRLTLGKASLLMIGLGTGALMGVPGFGIEEAPLGPIEGIVRTDAGTLLEDVEVVLFDDDDLSLLEITRTDSRGRFAFGQEPARYHVFAQPREEHPELLLPGWASDRTRSARGGVEIQLYTGRWIDVTTTDTAGDALPATEVRVLDASYGTPRVVQRALTGPEGSVRILLPEEAHLGFFPAGDLAARWFTDFATDELTDQIEVMLGEGLMLSGSVHGADEEPLAQAIVSVWEPEYGSWLGWAKSDDQGQVSMRISDAGSRQEVLLRVIDPQGAYLPLETLLQGDGFEGQQWSMTPGQEREIQTDVESLGGPARVYAYSDLTQAWSWGVTTDEKGQVHTSLAPSPSLVAVPTKSEAPQQEAWDLEIEGAGLQLQAPWVDGN